MTDDDCERLWWGQILRLLTWIHVGFGWLAAIMLDDAVRTLVKRD